MKFLENLKIECRHNSDLSLPFRSNDLVIALENRKKSDIELSKENSTLLNFINLPQIYFTGCKCYRDVYVNSFFPIVD